MAAPYARRVQPAAGQLWLSRPPFLLTACILELDEAAGPGHVTYDLIDCDGSRLAGPVREPLDESWWANFQPLVRRQG